MVTEISLSDVRGLIGMETGLSDWVTVDQTMIDAFASATDDHQFIHVDPERAAAESPFGGTIAHGYLTLSLLEHFNQELIRIETSGARLNYGLNKVRFPNPVKVGARIRCTASLTALTDVPAGKQMITSYVLEIEGEDKPACVAEMVVLLLT
jgi:acyl dehydratase